MTNEALRRGGAVLVGDFQWAVKHSRSNGIPAEFKRSAEREDDGKGKEEKITPPKRVSGMVWDPEEEKGVGGTKEGTIVLSK